MVISYISKTVNLFQLRPGGEFPFQGIALPCVLVCIRVCMYFTVIALSLSFSPSLLPSQMFMAFTHMVLRTKKQSQSRAEREREREKETVDINSHRHRERRKRGKKCCWGRKRGDFLRTGQTNGESSIQSLSALMWKSQDITCWHCTETRLREGKDREPLLRAEFLP